MKKTEAIILDGKEYMVSLIPGKRKSISIRMLEPDLIELRYPGWYGKNKALDTLRSKTSWVIKKSSRLESARESGAGKGIYDGRMIYYRGEQCRVSLNGSGISVSDGIMSVPHSCSSEEIEIWYRNETAASVRNFMAEFKEIIPDCTIKVKKQKTIWGSCNKDKRIYINSRLAMCPDEVVEYVLWHEISHLTQMNHSKDFYNVLEMYCPGYRSHIRWLREHGHMLRI